MVVTLGFVKATFLIRLKRLFKIKDFNKITDNIYLGSKFYIPENMVEISVCFLNEGGYIPAIILDIIVEWIAKNVELNNKVYVHCIWGRGRSPLVVMSYLAKYLKMTPDEAKRFVKARRSAVWLTDDQEDSLDDYYKWLENK